jgi:hypothetical protein
MSDFHQPPRDADLRRFATLDEDPIHSELRHRGELLVAYPGAELWKAVGGSDGVAALIKDLYRRIEQDELLRVAFPQVNSEEATRFFVQWLGRSREMAAGTRSAVARAWCHRRRFHGGVAGRRAHTARPCRSQPSAACAES